MGVVPDRRQAQPDGAVVGPRGCRRLAGGEVVADPVLPEVAADPGTQRCVQDAGCEGRHETAEPTPEPCGSSAAPGDDAEGPVGDLDQPLRDGATLAFVTVQRGRVEVALGDVGQEVGEVVGVLQAGVHALSADGRVHVGGIPGEEGRPLRNRVATRWWTR